MAAPHTQKGQYFCHFEADVLLPHTFSLAWLDATPYILQCSKRKASGDPLAVFLGRFLPKLEPGFSPAPFFCPESTAWPPARHIPGLHPKREKRLFSAATAAAVAASRPALPLLSEVSLPPLRCTAPMGSTTYYPIGECAGPYIFSWSARSTMPAISGDHSPRRSALASLSNWVSN
jgi:hypothetical protein